MEAVLARRYRSAFITLLLTWKNIISIYTDSFNVFKWYLQFGFRVYVNVIRNKIQVAGISFILVRILDSQQSSSIYIEERNCWRFRVNSHIVSLVDVGFSFKDDISTG